MLYLRACYSPPILFTNLSYPFVIGWTPGLYLHRNQGLFQCSIQLVDVRSLVSRSHSFTFWKPRPAIDPHPPHALLYSLIWGPNHISLFMHGRLLSRFYSVYPSEPRSIAGPHDPTPTIEATDPARLGRPTPRTDLLCVRSMLPRQEQLLGRGTRGRS